MPDTGAPVRRAAGTVRRMTTELLHGDLCPLCGQPFTLRPTVIVHSNVPPPPGPTPAPLHRLRQRSSQRAEVERPDERPLRPLTRTARMLRHDFKHHPARLSTT